MDRSSSLVHSLRSRQDESREEMQSTPSSPYKSYKVFGFSDLHSPLPLASNLYDKYIKHRIFHIGQTVHLDDLHGFAIQTLNSISKTK